MARRTERKSGRRREAAPEESVPQSFSLEDILSEYRLSVAETEDAQESAPASEPIPMQPEEDGILTAQVPESAPAAPEEPLEEPTVPEEPWEEPAEPADPWEEPEEPEPEASPAADGAEDVFEEMYAPEELTPWQEPEAEETPAPRAGRQESKPADPPAEEPVEAEGFQDDRDFYAGAMEPSPEGEGDEDAAFSDAPGEETTSHSRENTGGQSGLGKFWEKLTGALAAASYRREQRRRQAPPEPENSEKEMAPDKAARYYASQMPALRLRSFGALAVCVLLSWITLGSGLGGGLPGSLAYDARLAAMVLLVGQIAVLLLGLDVITAGIMSLVRGRPGAESLLVTASLASVIDTLAIILSRDASRGIPFGAVTSLGVFFALRGGWHNARGYHDTFLALFHSADPAVIAREELPEGNSQVLVTSRRETKGFVRRSEEPGEAELLSGMSYFPLVLGSAALALAAAVGGGDIGAFFHVFALMTAVCAGFGWLFSYPFLFSKTARHLMVRGSALAGWSGARDMGTGRRLVIRDTDIFPEDTMEITGIRLLDKSKAQHIIACTGTMLSTAGTGTARVFTELMRRHKAAIQTVEDFSVGEGGCKGTIQYREVRVGSLGYMYLSGIKIPDKLKTENAVFTALDGELAGVFLFRYRPVGSVQRALYTLRRQHRHPLFTARDFNIDPLLVREAFDISTEGFEFPPFPERYRIAAALAEGKNPAAGVMARDGLDLIVDLAESGTQLFLLGRICAWAALAGGVLGMALMLVPCWLGNWAAASAWRVLVYSLLWLAPALGSRLLLRK